MFLINGAESKDVQRMRNIDLYHEQFQRIINTNIIGHQLKPSQWKIPKNDQQGYLVGSISMNNRTTRKILNGINPLIDLSIRDPTMNDKWKQAIKLYLKVIEIIHQKKI